MLLLCKWGTGTAPLHSLGQGNGTSSGSMGSSRPQLPAHSRHINFYSTRDLENLSLPNDPKWLRPSPPSIPSPQYLCPISGVHSSPLNSSCALAPRMASSVDVLVSICVVFAMSFVPASFTLELSLGHGAGTAWRGGGPATTCHWPFWPFLGRDLCRMAQVKSWGLWETSCPATQSTGRRSGWGTVPRVPVPTPAH